MVRKGVPIHLYIWEEFEALLKNFAIINLPKIRQQICLAPYSYLLQGHFFAADSTIKGHFKYIGTPLAIFVGVFKKAGNNF